MPIWPLFIILSFAILVYISLWFLLAQYTRRLDVIDSAWGLGFIYITLLALLITLNFELIPMFSVALTSLWGLRLFIHISARNLKKSEDSRYTAYRKKWQKNFAVQAYFRLYLVQAALILAISSALLGIITSENFIEPIAYAGLFIWATGIIFESVADVQLNSFLKSKKDKNLIMDKGLWRYSRHPNYFGEIVVWVGAGVVSVSAGAWWGLVSPAIIIILLTRVSGIPLLEKRYAQNPSYQKYRQKTSALIPLPPRG